jgi:type I restriction enzyme S subunit
MDQVIWHLKNGYFQSPTGATSGHRILRINAVRPMRVDLDEIRYLDQLSGDSAGYYVEDGDLLFTRYNGSVELLGVAGMVRGCSQPTLHPDKLICVKTAGGQPLAAYLEIACNVGEARKHMRSRARTTAGQTGISGVDIREMPVPLPPMAEQAEIVAEVERRLSIVDELEAQVAADLKRAGRLRQSILKRAFAGRLVPQDPSDEPAAKLLERISRQRTTSNPKRKR